MGKFAINILLLLLLRLACAAQDNPVIPVSRVKTTYIILYNTKPESANIGGEEGAILYAEQKTSRDTVKIIKLQAAKENFTSTNLLVVCTDTIMEFTLVYQPNPAVTRYSYRYTGNVMNITTARTSADGTKPATVNAAPAADSVTGNGITISAGSLERLYASRRQLNRSSSVQGLYFFLDAVGLDSSGLHHFFKLRVRNSTAVSYAIDYIKFIVEAPHKRMGSRAGNAVQDDYPPYLSAPRNVSIIAAGESQELIYVVDKLPLNKGEQLTIIMKEQAGNSRGRTLTLEVPAAVLLKKEKVLQL
ncbi:DUF4138 domain-containing protein [Chitinophaga tropicalis]|uniref:DUF4138 domain-containing protein n=1 Tax=Chitinophaga tropicalis TaxID=2683588 RepID=A0A7K1UDQ1_9BACT|nr:DUF4138 domain-containing protein [Chitinophaga tropicalis]MVT12514.1 DUF4138 domain-containing protein [Chitinophaga tropicalis]